MKKAILLVFIIILSQFAHGQWLLTKRKAIFDNKLSLRLPKQWEVKYAKKVKEGYTARIDRNMSNTSQEDKMTKFSFIEITVFKTQNHERYLSDYYQHTEQLTKDNLKIRNIQGILFSGVNPVNDGYIFDLFLSIQNNQFIFLNGYFAHPSMKTRKKLIREINRIYRSVKIE